MAKKKTEIPKEIQVYTEGCDFCMQFDYDEPHVVGASPDGDGGLEIVLKAYQDAGITFVCPNTGKKPTPEMLKQEKKIKSQKMM